MPLIIDEVKVNPEFSDLDDKDFGRFMRLLISQWISGDVPLDPKTAIRVCGSYDTNDVDSFARLLEDKFPIVKGDRRINPWLDRIRNKVLQCQRRPVVFDQFDTPVERRRERMRRAGNVTQLIRGRILERDGYKCLACGTGDDLTIDHIHPVSLGGMTEDDNLQTLCRPCNSSKGARVG